MTTSTPTVRRLLTGALAASAAVALTATGSPAALAAAPQDAAPTADGSEPLRDVMWVGNNWSGTASVIDVNTYEVLQSDIDLIPDRDERVAEIHSRIDTAVMFHGIRHLPGEGNDQYVDDMFTTPDGKHLAVSRPSFADVVWIDIEKATNGDPDSIVRRETMDGYRTDHMNVSPDGRRLVVSDATARQVIEYSMVDETLPDGTELRMGDRLRSFPSGETPHENEYTEDGELLFHASIGRVYLPIYQERFFDPIRDVVGEIKGDNWFQIVDPDTFEVLKRWDMQYELEQAGYPHMSGAVRPMALDPDGRYVYFQVSFYHGIVVFDLEADDITGVVDYTLGGIDEPRTGAVTRLIDLENRVPHVPEEHYVNDSAHHGLSINADGDTLCVAGTMDDYAALVDVETGEARYYDEHTTGNSYAKPYWTTKGPNDTCWISISQADSVAVLDTNTGEEIAYLPVGYHPQRVREGVVPERVVAGW